jgi:hypothetical protein
MIDNLHGKIQKADGKYRSDKLLSIIFNYREKKQIFIALSNFRAMAGGLF